MKPLRWLLLLTAIVLLFFWKIVFTKQFTVLSHWEVVNQAYSWYTFAAQSIQQGIVPLWDPYRYAGTTFVGEMTVGLFYPFKLALYLAPLNAYGLLSERVFNLFWVFSHWLAAVGMFFLVRRLKLGGVASLVSAICFGLGGFLLKAGWPNMVDAMAWLPFVVLFLLRAFETERRSEQIFNACVSGLALGMTFLAGSLHIAMMDGIVVVTLAAYLCVVQRERKAFATGAALVAIVALVSILIGAVQLLPSLEYAPKAYRWVGQDTPIRSFQKIPYAVLGDEANFGPESLFAFVFGEANTGNHEPSNYLGIMPLLLAIIGVWKHWSRPLVRYFTGLAVFAYLYSWGSFSFLHGILYLAPFLDMAREPGRFIYLTHFAMAILAAYGVDALFESRNVAGLTSVVKWVVIALGALLAAASVGLPVPVVEGTYLSFFFLAASYAVLLAAQRSRPFAGTVCVLVFLVLWDLYSFNPTIESKIELQKSNGDYLAQLIADRELAGFLRSQQGMARVHIDAAAPMNIGNSYNVPVTYAMSATLLVDYASLYGHPRQNQLFNVRYTIRSKDKKVDAIPVYSDKFWDVYENPDASPRAWLVHQVEVDSSPERPLSRLSGKEMDLQRTALVSQPIEGSLGKVQSDSNIEWVAYEPNRLELTVQAGSPSLLVLSEVFYPGWLAEVDGVPTTIHQVNGVLRGVRVEGGTHRLVMRYRPRSVYWGAAISLITLLAIGALWLRRYWNGAANV